MLTIDAWLRQNGARFQHELEILARAYFGISKAEFICESDQSITPNLRNYLSDALVKLKRGTPLAYLLGYKEFWSLEFQVNRNVLIPRPETELIIERSIELANHGDSVLELGTGSGAIAIALAKERPDLSITATDISIQALEVARENARKHKCKITLEHSDWFESVSGTWNLILSNPPYIAENDPHLDFLAMEPRVALVSGPTGFEALDVLIENAHNHLKPCGHLIIEHGIGQAQEIKKKLASHHFTEISSHKDLANINRIVTAQQVSPEYG